MALKGRPPPYHHLSDIPGGELNLLKTLRDDFAALTGYTVAPTDAQLLAMANKRTQTLADFGRYMATQKNAQAAIKAMPWAGIGLTKDEYVSASNIFSTTYKEITGKEMSAAELHKAFLNPRDPTGGLLTGSEYKQQLMNDAAIQKNFGWVKYGMDFASWTQQKLQFRSAFGRDIQDAEAATILQYNKAATGPNMAAQARTQQAQQPALVGVGQSLAR